MVVFLEYSEKCNDRNGFGREQLRVDAHRQKIEKNYSDTTNNNVHIL